MRLALLLKALAPSQAAACAVCFGGDANSGTARGITIGIYMLLASVFSVLGVFVAAVWKIEKRRALAERESLT
jgi:hypothetical protein